MNLGMILKGLGVEEDLFDGTVVAMRHPLSKISYQEMFENNDLIIASSVQSKSQMVPGTKVLQFAGVNLPTGKCGILTGLYEVRGRRSIPHYVNSRMSPVPRRWLTEYPSFFDRTQGADPNYYHDLERVDDLDESLLIGRLKVEFPSVRNFRLTDKKKIKDLAVVEVSYNSVQESWPGYQELTLTYRKLTEILENPENYPDWQRRLTSVGGVYLIKLKVGRMRYETFYVGAAYSKEGFWGRWRNYVGDPTGGNVALQQLEEIYPGFEENMEFSILWEMHISANARRAQSEALYFERIYKEKLGSRAIALEEADLHLGLNRN